MNCTDLSRRKVRAKRAPKNLPWKQDFAGTQVSSTSLKLIIASAKGIECLVNSSLPKNHGAALLQVAATNPVEFGIAGRRNR